MKKTSKISSKPGTSRTKKQSGPTQWDICKQLAEHFKVAPQSVKSWFASGCPQVFDEAVQWKTQRDADRAIRSVSGRPNRLLKVIQGKTEAAQADDYMSIAELSATFAEAVGLVVELRQAGLTTTRLAEITGFSTPVIKRVCHEHPDLRPKKQAAVSWSLARSLAVDRLIDALDSEESSRKMSASQLAVVAGVCSDKLRDLEQPTESSVINIRAKIESLSFEELINSIPKQADAIDGEFTFEPAQLEDMSRESSPLEQSSEGL
jgi:hypothetical protein